MFGIIADLIASVATIVLPCYLSYKSLRLGDPAQTTPWLIYFIILTLTLLAESWTLFIIGWMPFYSWFRLFFLLYLVLPQTQGAKHLYLTYFEPFILHHESQIDDFIGQTHRRLEQMGLGYMNFVIEWLREKVLGQKSPQPHAASSIQPGAAGYVNYASDLLSRFAMPAARTSAAPSINAGGVLNMLSSAAGAALAAGATTSSAGGTSRSVPASAQAASIPDSFLTNMSSMPSDQRSSFVTTQRDRLNAMIRALDREQQSLDLAYGDPKTAASRRSPSSQGGEFTKSKSQMSFDNIDYDDIHSSSASGGNGSGYPSQHSTPPTMRQHSGQGQNRRTTSGNWVTGSLGGWLGGTSREDTHRDRDRERDHDRERDDYDDGYRDVPRNYREERRSPKVSGANYDDDYLSRGYSTAKDSIEAIARGQRDRERDRDYR